MVAHLNYTDTPVSTVRNLSALCSVARGDLFGCTDTSDLRRFGPKTFRHHLYFVHRIVTLIYCLRKITLLMTYGTYFRTFCIHH